MTYSSAIRYLESFVNYEQICSYSYKGALKLQRIRGLLEVLGNPQKALSCVHIAGSKGKGSTSVMTAYILREAGLRVGLYTSPHLCDFRERLRILDPSASSSRRRVDFEGMIAKGSLTKLVAACKPLVEKYNRKSLYGPLTFFEVYTAIAFEYFKAQKTDVVVLETGLGGRLDATNAANALVSALTPISMEHTRQLGNTLSLIAFEKTGIIKDNAPLVLVSSLQAPEVRRVIRKRCTEKRLPLYEVGRDILYRKERSGFSVKGRMQTYRNLRIVLPGDHQLVNASVAIGIVEALNMLGFSVNAGHIRRGLAHTRWPGRCEVIRRRPDIILDGAQNRASAMTLVSAIKNNFVFRKLVLVFGISRDKDVKGVVSVLNKIADSVIVTQARTPRAYPAGALKKFFKGKETTAVKTVQDALASAQNTARTDDLIVVTGSLFVVGEAREKLRGG